MSWKVTPVWSNKEASAGPTDVSTYWTGPQWTLEAESEAESRGTSSRWSVDESRPCLRPSCLNWSSSVCVLCLSARLYGRTGLFPAIKTCMLFAEKSYKILFCYCLSCRLFDLRHITVPRYRNRKTALRILSANVFIKASPPWSSAPFGLYQEFTGPDPDLWSTTMMGDKDIHILKVEGRLSVGFTYSRCF